MRALCVLKRPLVTSQNFSVIVTESDIHIFHDLALYCGDGSFFFLWLDYVNEFSEHGPCCHHLHPGGTWGGCSGLLPRRCRKSHWSALAKAENSCQCHFPDLFMLFHCRVRISCICHFLQLHMKIANNFLSHAQGNNLVCDWPTASEQ